MSLTLSNGVETCVLPSLVFGTSNFSDIGKKAHYFTLLDAFWQAGGRCIDTARSYGDGISEQIIGSWLSERKINRKEIFLISKGGFPYPEDMHASRLEEEHILSDLSKSLTALGISYIDVYFLHRDKPDESVSTFVDILDKLIAQGKIRFGGVSNWEGARIEAANRYAYTAGKHPISVSQINFSLAKTTPLACGDDTLICMNETEKAFYQKSSLPLMAYATMAKGYFSKRLEGQPLSEKVIKRYDSEENRCRGERVLSLSKTLSVDPATLVLAYLTSHPVKTAAIFGASLSSQIEKAMAAEQLQLKKEEIKFLEA